MGKVTLSGKPADPNYTGPAPQPIDESGQHRDYWVLSPEERSKGFVRPVRLAYRHDRCSVATKMHLAIAESFAANPVFYSHTFCSTCKNHYPVNEFTWLNSTEKVGT